MTALVGLKAIAGAMGISVSKMQKKHLPRMREEGVILFRRVRRPGRKFPVRELFCWENRLQAYCTRYYQEIGPI